MAMAAVDSARDLARRQDVAKAVPVVTRVVPNDSRRFAVSHHRTPAGNRVSGGVACKCGCQMVSSQSRQVEPGRPYGSGTAVPFELQHDGSDHVVQ